MDRSEIHRTHCHTNADVAARPVCDCGAAERLAAELAAAQAKLDEAIRVVRVLYENCNAWNDRSGASHEGRTFLASLTKETPCE